MANVIEVLLRGTDNTAGLRRGIDQLKTAFATLGAGALLGKLVQNINEAERSAALLDSAFRNTGATLGLTRKQLDELATSMQNTTTVGDELAKEAQALLLSFDKVRGDAFERTLRVSADLAETLGGDLKSSIRQVGLSLQDPAAGLSLLRRSGISFSESQKDLISTLIDTGNQAKAQDIILSELERRFGGAASAARNTLGGALIGLKNAFGDLFEGTKEGTSGATDAINSLTDALSKPEIKEGIDVYVAGLGKIAELLGSLIGLIGRFGAKAAEVLSADGFLGKTLRGMATLVPGLSGAIALASTPNPKKEPQYGYDASSRFPWETGNAYTPKKLELEEVVITLERVKDDYASILQEMDELTRSSTEKQAADFVKLKTTLEFLRDEGLVSPEKYSERLDSALDDLLPEIDLNQIKAMYKSVKQESTELSEFIKGVWQGAGNSIRQTLSDAAYEGRLSLRSLVDIARRVVADIIAAFTTSSLKEVFTDLLKSNSKSSGGTGFLSAVAGLFGFAAGGGDISRPTWVGEEGRELVVPGHRGAHVYNARQLAGGGGGVSYAPVTNLQVIERENSAATAEAVLSAVAIQRGEDMEELMRLLERSGVELRT